MNETSGEFSSPISKQPESFLSRLKNKFKSSTTSPQESKIAEPVAPPNIGIDAELKKLGDMFDPTPEKSHQQVIDELQKFEQQQQSVDQEKLRILREARSKQDNQTKSAQEILNNHFSKLGSDNPQKK